MNILRFNVVQIMTLKIATNQPIQFNIHSSPYTVIQNQWFWIYAVLSTSVYTKVNMQRGKKKFLESMFIHFSNNIGNYIHYTAISSLFCD